MNWKIAVVLGSLIAAPAWAQFGGQPTVEVAEAESREMSPTMQVAGTVLSRSDASLSAEVEGRLIDVSDVGTRVAAGDVVARIEDTVLQLRVAELEAEIDSTQARLAFLNAELARVERLAETNLAAASQIDQTRSERDMARSDLAVTRSRSRAAAGPDRSDPRPRAVPGRCGRARGPGRRARRRRRADTAPGECRQPGGGRARAASLLPLRSAGRRADRGCRRRRSSPRRFVPS